MNNINTFSNFQNDNSQQPSCKERMKAAWATVPFFVRFIITSTIFFYILSWLVRIDFVLCNLPYYTIKYFQIWRLLTSVFMTVSIINILFAFLSWIPDAIRLETTAGTVRYFLNFMTNSIFIQILYSFVLLILSIFAGDSILKMPSAGLWPLIMAEITLLCLANPDNEVRMFLIPCPMKARYYPWALLAFFTLLNMRLQFDLIAGVGYAYLFNYYLRSKIQFSDNFVQKCENSFLFKCFSNWTGFISLNMCNSNSGFTAYGQNQNSNSAAAHSRYVPDPSYNNQPVTTPFKGKGTVVGKNMH
jgi:membrane associated rhomboid family serine protease